MSARPLDAAYDLLAGLRAEIIRDKREHRCVQWVDATLREVEAVEGRLQSLIAERDAARAELAQAREVLRSVEWLPGDLRPDEPRWCMVCMSYEPHHAPDCKLNAARGIGAEGGAA